MPHLSQRYKKMLNHVFLAAKKHDKSDKSRIENHYLIVLNSFPYFKIKTHYIYKKNYTFAQSVNSSPVLMFLDKIKT